MSLAFLFEIFTSKSSSSSSSSSSDASTALPVTHGAFRAAVTVVSSLKQPRACRHHFLVLTAALKQLTAPVPTKTFYTIGNFYEFVDKAT